MEKEDATEYEQLAVYQKLVVNSVIKGIVRVTTQHSKTTKRRDFVKEKINTYAF